MKTIHNTLPFDPEFKSENFKLIPSSKRGRIFITENEVTTGEDIIKHIEDNINDIFLVSKPVFDFLKTQGKTNVAMFDPEMTEYNKQGKAVCQRGLILANES
jgi:hypothetical protein